MLPFGKLGGSPRVQDKGGRIDNQKGERNIPKITKEGCKTYQNGPKRGENLINDDVLKEKTGVEFLCEKKYSVEN